MTISMTTLSMTTLSIMEDYCSISVSYAKCFKSGLCAECHYAECLYAECRGANVIRSSNKALSYTLIIDSYCNLKY